MVEARLDMVGLVVEDIARSLAFYRRLGMAIPEAADGEPHVEVTLAGGLRMAWDTAATVASFDEGWSLPPAGGGRIGLAFLVTDPAAVDAAHDELVAAGHTSHLAPFDAVWGQRYATVVDPDGNGVDLFAPLPG